MIESFEFEEFLRAVRAEIADESDSDLKETRRPSRFTEFVTSCMAEYGIINDAQICYVEKATGKGTALCIGWFLDEGEGRLDLVVTVFFDDETSQFVGKQRTEQVVKQAIRLYKFAIGGHLDCVDPAHQEEYDLLNTIYVAQSQISQIRVFVVTDGTFGKLTDHRLELEPGLVALVGLWDLQRIYKIRMSGRDYEPIAIDFVERFGTPLSCLEMPSSNDEYRAYLAIFPGDQLAALYDEFGSRLMELNVRSFLQQRGKVNRGIRDTIIEHPTRFLAYNNGISATVEGMVTVRVPQGDLAISRVQGFQVVNGGQTVASLHRAMKAEKCSHLDQVFVQAKISVVKPEYLDELVPLISRYSNTQNRVNEADFSSNDPFHIRIERLAETTWSPGEQSRWFYERARGQYDVARNRHGATPAKRRVFDQQQPRKQKFTKTDLAKYENCWDQKPDIVGQGAQKNFVHYMKNLYKVNPAFEPDVVYYKKLIAKAILYKFADSVARKHKFPGYRANAVAYTLALISFKTLGRLDLIRVWDQQGVSPALDQVLNAWMPDVWNEIVTSAGQRNVTEWAKKKECWERVQLLDVEISPELEEELSEGDPLPNVGRQARNGATFISSADRENIARVMQVNKTMWREISDWGQESENLQPWQHGIALTLSGYAAGNWSKVPSVKQARQAVEILRIAKEAGIIGVSTEDQD
jgi:hypothetical protein